jgi:hypothetical protein
MWLCVAGMYLALAALFLADVPGTVVQSVAVATGALSVLVCFMDPLRGLYLTILATHMGAACRWQMPVVGMVTPGDIHLIALTISSFWRASLQDRFYIGPFPTAVGLLTFLSLATAALAPDLGAVAPGVINQMQVALVYFLTLNLVKDDRQATVLIRMIGFAVFASAVVHIVAYSQGRNLLLAAVGTESEFVTAGQESQREALMFFNKTSFFYGSFIASCSVVLTLALSHLAFSHERSRFVIFWSIVGLVVLASSLLQGSRTIIAATAVSCGAMCILGVGWMLRQRWLRRRLLVFTILGPLIVAGAFVVQMQVSTEAQYRAYFSMFLEEGSGSLSERLEMWGWALEKAGEYPKELLIGLGQDVPMRAPDLPQVKEIMNVPGHMIQIPSFHNFYVDGLFQNGLLFTSIAGYIVLYTMLGLTLEFRRRYDPIVRDCLFALLAWLVMWNSHATGWSKPVLIFGHLMGLAHLALRPYYGSRSNDLRVDHGSISRPEKN